MIKLYDILALFALSKKYSLNVGLRYSVLMGMCVEPKPRTTEYV